MYFVLRWVEQKLPNSKYSFKFKAELLTGKQWNLHNSTGWDRLLNAEYMVLFFEDIDELQAVRKLYHETYFDLTIAIAKTKTLSLNVAENVMTTKSPILLKS